MIFRMGLSGAVGFLQALWPESPSGLCKVIFRMGLSGACAKGVADGIPSARKVLKHRSHFGSRYSYGSCNLQAFLFAGSSPDRLVFGFRGANV